MQVAPHVYAVGDGPAQSGQGTVDVLLPFCFVLGGDAVFGDKNGDSRSCGSVTDLSGQSRALNAFAPQASGTFNAEPSVDNRVGAPKYEYPMIRSSRGLLGKAFPPNGGVAPRARNASMVGMAIFATRRMLTKRQKSVVVIGIAVALVAVSGGVVRMLWPRDSGQSPYLTVDDPRPQPTGEGVSVGAEGGQVGLGDVEVTVPPGAVAAGNQVTVVPLADLGERLGEVFGRPVRVEHSQPLQAPVTIRWSAATLSPIQRAIAVLARWDPDLSVWRLTNETITVDGESLVAQTSEFSDLTRAIQ